MRVFRQTLAAVAAAILAGCGPAVTIEVDRQTQRLLLRRDGILAAEIVPVARAGGAAPLAIERAGDTIHLSGPGLRARLQLTGDELTCRLEAGESVEGPIVLVPGALEQGLLAGVEHLGRGEASSSTLDIHGPEADRREPDPMKLTMPLAAFVTGRVCVAMLWTDTSLQPTYATGGGGREHRMSLKGRRVEATIRVGPGFAEGGRVEDAVVWGVRKRGGLPAVPPRPRTEQAQKDLCMAAYTKSGTVAGSSGGRNGWYHAGGMPSQPKFFADHASSIWRLTGQTPPLRDLVPGGSHVPNDAIWFVTGRAEQWLREADAAAAAIRKDQRPDGSFGVDGPMREGHFEDTASGPCAIPAARLLEHARLTGNRESLAAGLKTLEYMKRFRTPRGAQPWEIPLHSPDLLASAYLVWAYTRGYELTGNGEYLALARRWAVSGVPFVYQWSNRPVMLYATTPVIGATLRKVPVWVGLPVQWCGTVYAYALLMLAGHDATLDWRRLAEGMLVTAEQMQYPDGSFMGWGCLPDSFGLPRQDRRPPDINPSALVSLRLLLDGQLDSLAVAADADHRVVAPFPVALEGRHAVVSARKGVEYQVLIDGSRVVTVQSAGRDVIDLAPPAACPLPGHPGNVFLAGEMVSLPVPNASDWTLADSAGYPVARGSAVSGRAAPGQLPVGWYDLRAGELRTSLAVLAPLAAATPADSPISVDAAITALPPERQKGAASLLAMAGANWARDRMYWPQIEPARGRFVRTWADSAADAHAGAGVKVLQVHHATPAWANPDPTRFPPDLRDAHAFEKECARRWKGKVQAFEPWNEAEWFGGHTGAELASLQKASYLGLKAGNPLAIAGLNALPGAHESVLADLAANEAWPYFDTFNFHCYWAAWAQPAVYAQYRAASAGRSLWVTEANVPGPWWPDHPGKTDPDLADLEHARAVARVYATAIHEGASQVFYFFWTMLMNDDLTPRRSYVAVAACGRLLAGAKPLGRLPLAGTDATVLLFRARPDGQERDVAVAWVDDGTGTLDGSKAVGVYDHWGAAKPPAPALMLSPAPTFVVFPAGSFKAAPLEKPPVMPAWKQGAASPIVLQALWPREKVDVRQSAYRLVAGRPQEIPVYLYNFGSAPARGRLHVQVAGGWTAQLPEAVEIAPGDRKRLALLVTPSAGPLATARISGDFGAAGAAVLSLRLLAQPER